MEKKGVISDLLHKIHKNKKLEMIIYIVIAAIVVLLYFAASGADKKKTSDETDKKSIEISSTNAADVEKRLADTLSKIRGVGNVTVMITYDTSTEIVPAMSSQMQSSEAQTGDGFSKNETESNQLATINTGGEQQPVVITEIQPKVRGVIVIAEGAADITVRMNLEYATATVLGVDADAIEVFEMNAS